MRPLFTVCVLTAALLPVAACGTASKTDNNGGGAVQAAATTVTITEKQGPPDKYTFSPASVQLSKGASLAMENKTDEDHSIACKPDAGTGTVMIEKSETKSATFSTAGTFTCTSSEHPEATLTVTVK